MRKEENIDSNSTYIFALRLFLRGKNFDLRDDDENESLDRKFCLLRMKSIRKDLLFSSVNKKGFLSSFPREIYVLRKIKVLSNFSNAAGKTHSLDPY